MSLPFPRDTESTEQVWFAKWRPGASCPPPEVLLPSVEGMLPEAAARRVRTHVDGCELCRELLETLSSSDVSSPNASELGRVDSRVRAAMSQGFRTWMPYAAAAALMLAAGAGYVAWTIGDSQSRVARLSVPTLPNAPAARPTTDVRPEFVLALQRPEIELPPESLTLRSGTQDTYSATLDRALEPFSRQDYATAATRFEQLTRTYPTRPHPAYYLGVSLLMRGAAADAVRHLEQAQARSAPGTSLHAEAVWYRAVALERSGQHAPAALALMDLCGSGGARDAQACDGLRSLLTR